MHEFHAWIGLAESAEESDLGGLAEAVGELEELAADSKWHDAVFEVRNLNGQYFLRADGMVNRRREEGERLDLFLAVIARRLPGSWGLVYERDDEMPDPPGPNAFRVRVLARGSVVERPDPFLSPVHPVIENLPCSLYFPPRSPMFSRGPSSPASVRTRLTQSGPRPLLWAHELPEQGISYRISSSGRNGEISPSQGFKAPLAHP